MSIPGENTLRLPKLHRYALQEYEKMPNFVA